MTVYLTFTNHQYVVQYQIFPKFLIIQARQQKEIPVVQQQRKRWIMLRTPLLAN